MARLVAFGRAGNTTPDRPMMSWHSSPERYLTHFPAFSGCLENVVTESASPLNIEARWPVGPIGVGAMPMFSFFPLAWVRPANVEIIHEPFSAIAAIPDCTCLSGPTGLLPPI